MIDQSGEVAPQPAPPQNAPETEPQTLVLDLDGFEGPLDLLLSLAQTQKVDLTHLSILTLAEQFLDYIAKAKSLKLDLAADYLVMAAWLAYLKSRLLLPDPPDENEDEPSAEELARHLAHRLRRLVAMRKAGDEIMKRPRLGVDIFPRGMPEQTRTNREITYDADLFDLLKAYAQRRVEQIPQTVVIKRRTVWSIKQARLRLESILGLNLTWAPLDKILAELFLSPDEHQTAIASTFVASLEMAREGRLELRQAQAFGPLYIKTRSP